MTVNSPYNSVQAFVNLAIENGAIEAMDAVYQRNQLLHFLGMKDWQEVEGPFTDDSLSCMAALILVAKANGVIPEGGEEAYTTALMDFITPLPSRVNQEFWTRYEIAPESATDYFYALTKCVDQVKTQGIARNITFEHASDYGNLEITINLSKPEKDPKAIAALKTAESSSDYPACPLCMDNEGFYGAANKAARSNHRLVRLKLNNEDWAFQYSPYAYYNEHAILLNQKHVPMVTNKETFRRLLDFLKQFPHYMIGANADLPIVGGSILNHDHYQAGRHIFPMMKADIREEVILKDFPQVKAAIVNWPMSVLRLKSSHRENLVSAAYHVLEQWKIYSDEPLYIHAQSADGTGHHTITSIAYKKNEQYVLDLVLRDNNISSEYPDGIFHPHPELHHIKKENIGLIEVMGLAILPPRLKNELKEVEKYLLDKDCEVNKVHIRWANQLKLRLEVSPENVEQEVQAAVGDVFAQVLKDAGVFKDDENGHAGFKRFIAFLNE
ncbi:UDP-glucose--hexose-1-phosphate uridylyltransferase [Lactococcus ileimucosae]|uniref:Galactose-1-phosphate uridylyltransferase n=1 Tax=Lactococcus ileimucosae TaxID=2941329 RepID=A0ABV4D4I8_9LACT